MTFTQITIPQADMPAHTIKAYMQSSMLVGFNNMYPYVISSKMSKGAYLQRLQGITKALQSRELQSPVKAAYFLGAVLLTLLVFVPLNVVALKEPSGMPRLLKGTDSDNYVLYYSIGERFLVNLGGLLILSPAIYCLIYLYGKSVESHNTAAEDLINEKLNDYNRVDHPSGIFWDLADEQTMAYAAHAQPSKKKQYYIRIYFVRQEEQDALHSPSVAPALSTMSPPLHRQVSPPSS